jgi:hypothetical protein
MKGKRILMSPAVHALGLPAPLVHDMCSQLRQEVRRHKRHRTFLYMRFVLLVPPGGPPQLAPVGLTMIAQDVEIIELVGTLFLRRLRQSNIHADPGDITFNLRSDWNEGENPVD